MHLGNVMSVLLSYLSVKSKGGSWLLRIEDLDTARTSLDAARVLEEDLIDLGLEWDEGGVDQGCCQSMRSEIYEQALKALDVYPCYCSRSDLISASAPHESDGRVVYNGRCRDLAPSERPQSPFSLRVRVPDYDVSFVDGHYGEQRINLARDCGDFIVRRKDGGAAYQLAVTVDDLLMGVTKVVRGRDLLLSTHQQIFLGQCLMGPLGLGQYHPAPSVPGQCPPAPSVESSGYPISFCHTPLLCGADGIRLSKRDMALDLGELLRKHSPREIIGQLAYLCGIIDTPDPCTPSDLIPLFDISRVPLEDICLTDVPDGRAGN